MDDTLVVAVGDSWGDAAARAEIAVARVVREITDMFLKYTVDIHSISKYEIGGHNLILDVSKRYPMDV